MDKLNPKAAGAFVAVLVIIAGIVIFKTTIGNRVGAPPPIMSGGPSAAQVTLPGKESAVKGTMSGVTGSSGNVLPSAPGGGGGAPAPGGGGMALPGAGGGTAPPGGGGMTLPGAPPGPP